MSEIPGDLKFMKSHEWARVEGDGKVTVGISDHAQGLLGDLVYVDLPSVGDRVEAGNACAVVESVKAASDVYAPVSGTVTAVNGAPRFQTHAQRASPARRIYRAAQPGLRGICADARRPCGHAHGPETTPPAQGGRCSNAASPMPGAHASLSARRPRAARRTHPGRADR